MQLAGRQPGDGWQRYQLTWKEGRKIGSVL